MKNPIAKVLFLYCVGVIVSSVYGGIWTEDQDIEYLNGEGKRVFVRPQKGSTFTISSTDFELGKEISYCTVEEVFLQKTLHYSNPEDSTHPDVLQVGRHATLDKSNPKECKVVVKNAGDQDDGTWHFQVGYGDNREEMQWYQHSVVVQVKTDCEWGPWIPGRKCFKKKGKRRDTRDMSQGAMYGGKPCKGKHYRIVPCKA